MKCCICGTECDPEDYDEFLGPGKWYPTVDHIHPASEGGKNTLENLRTAHKWCNEKRNRKPWREPRTDREALIHLIRDTDPRMTLVERISNSKKVWELDFEGSRLHGTRVLWSRGQGILEVFWPDGYEPT